MKKVEESIDDILYRKKIFIGKRFECLKVRTYSLNDEYLITNNKISFQLNIEFILEKWLLLKLIKSGKSNKVIYSNYSSISRISNKWNAWK